MSPILEAAAGLRLHLDTWRLSWREPDWWGPVSFALCHGGESYTQADRLEPVLRAFEGEDDLGAYGGVEVSWQRPALPVRTSVRAYRDQSVIVFRVEAATALRDLSTGVFERPSVAWPALLPPAKAAGG